MGDQTKIEWADRTFNPWEGCQKVGPGCDHCYAEAQNSRWNGGTAPNWGPGAPRRRTTAANWRKPLKWNREAEAAGRRDFVFCASLADVFDNAVDPAWRVDLFALIRETPHLTWLLLTKRPGNILAFRPLPDLWPRNAAIGCTVVNQAEADRDIPKLLEAKRVLNPAFAFLSMEPLLEPVDISWHLPGPDWVIVGGESGPHARPMSLEWARSLRDQCERFGGVVFNFKQAGGRGPDKGGNTLDGQTYFGRPGR